MPLRALALSTLLLTTALPASAQQEDAPIAPGIGVRVAERYVAPVLSQFEQATADLAAAVGELCRSPGAERLEAARASFAETVDAWGRASVLRFGPLQADNRYESIFFWPDPRGIALRQVQAVLAERDESAASAAALAQKSAALQGMPALEFVLFGTGHEALLDPDSGFRCRYGLAIAGNLETLAREIGDGWDAGGPFHAAFTAPAPDRDPYRSTVEVAGELVKAVGTALQFVRNAELQPPLGEAEAKANGRRAPLWRSGLTFDLAASQIEGADALFVAAFEGALPEGAEGVFASIRFELEHALQAIRDIETPAETAFADTDERGRIGYATLALHGANEALNGSFSAAIGLTMGFNALDGD